jgi:hypothetical protein
MPQDHAIFLHTGWRSGGTWIWARLRAQPGVMGFYEPLHEVLGTIDQPLIESMTAGSWDSRHGATSPYFLEYAPLLRPARSGVRRGVAGYEPRFAYERFFLDVDEPDEALERYIKGLLTAAASHGRIPALKFCRSLGRLGWMQRRFPGALHALILRNPVAQYDSATSQLAHGNRFFLVSPMVVMARNRQAPAVQAAVERMGVPLPALPSGRRDLDFELAWRHLQTLDTNVQFRAFLAFWTLTMVRALSCPGIVVIDADRLPTDEPYRASVEATLGQAARVIMRLDASPQPAPNAAPPGAAAAFGAAQDLLTDEARPHLQNHLRWPDTSAGALGVAPATWREADATGRGARLWQTLYFAAIGASMPARRLRGKFK